MTAPAPFIVGVGRSGTTLLRMMLDAHPDLAIPGETHFPLSLIQSGIASCDVETVFGMLTGAATWPNLAIDAGAFRTALASDRVTSPADAVRTFYQLYARQKGKKRWGDKTPPYRHCMVAIQKLLPEARFIHMIRDGRDVALSYRGLWFGPGDGIEAQARFWVEQVRNVRKQASECSGVLEVRYEELVSDPEACLRKICPFLELAFDPVMLDYHRTAADRLAEIVQPFGPSGTPSDPARFRAIYEGTTQPAHANRIGRWRAAMSEDELVRYEAIAGPMLSQLGYEIRTSGPASGARRA